MIQRTLEQAAVRADDEDLDAIIHLIGERGITPVFQPIVDLTNGEVYGYEVLSRGSPPLTSPKAMFDVAERCGISWDLEYACRGAALATIAALPPELRRKRFFLNVSPPTISDARFRDGFTLSTMRDHGLDQNRIILEITETTTVHDYAAFEAIVRHYVEQGFRIALDDFGSGHSGLLTLIALTPHFIKLDRELVTGIDASGYKQNLVRSLVAFAATVESHVIGEGVERVEELEILFRLGVRYAQGFLLAEPSPQPDGVGSAAAALIAKLGRRNGTFGFSLDSLLRGAIRLPPVFPYGTMRCRELDEKLRRSPEMDHIVLVSDGKPTGMITRRHFFSLLGGAYGYSMYSNKLIEELAKTEILVVPEDVDIRLLGDLAMRRSPDDLYDPVIVTDASGALKGSLTMKEVLKQAIEYEVRIASCSSPLTGLPGNIVIQSWLRDAFARPPFSVVYADLDYFKEYNDTYGFSRGDEMIALCARLLVQVFRDARTGHIGGDDFVSIFDGAVAERTLACVCAQFDEHKLSLFNPEDAERGWYEAVDRKGGLSRVPLVTLSLAVITSDNLPPDIHAGRLSRIIAGLKTMVKAMNLKEGKSGFLFERRRHGPESEEAVRPSLE